MIRPNALPSERKGAAFARRRTVFTRACPERGLSPAFVFPAFALVLAGCGQGGISRPGLGAKRVRDRGSLSEPENAFAKRHRAQRLHTRRAPSGFHAVQRVS